jgi:hypothetical protein
MNMPGFSADASLDEASGQYRTSNGFSSSTGRIVAALLRDPSSSHGGLGLGFLDRCDLRCWLRCVYRDRNPKGICDLYCGCLG